jgi:MFS transporter, ACS family, glucarate transporter
MRQRYCVLGLLVLFFAITYLDRVCISVAGPRMQEDLHIGPVGWGWVTGVFTLAYGLFEIPTGMLADRIGPRRVLTRIVLWWSAFTSLTGMVSSFYPLLLTRFCFGAGEAGAFPNSQVVVSRWFPASQRASIAGVFLTASQIGGALAPLLVIPIQMRYGWRASFYIFGSLGALWSIAWYAWFRDSPVEKRGVSAEELAETAQQRLVSEHTGFPWRATFRSPTALALMALAFSYIYAYNFFQTWFHTFLVKGRGFSEGSLMLSALPFVVAASANFLGGFTSDALVRRLGVRHGRRTLGILGLGCASLFTVAAMLTHDQMMTLIFLSLVYGAITFQQAGAFGICLDVAPRHAGTMMGLMNMAAQVGGLLGSLAFGYIVETFGSYDAPFIPMAALLVVGAWLWTRVDPSEELGSSVQLSPAVA